MSGPEDSRIGAQDDDAFERRLGARQRFFQAREFADGDAEPPAKLDRIVLAKAREAIRVSEPARVYRNPRWVVPVGLAATVVIGFAVTLVTPWGSQRAGLAIEETAAPAPVAADASAAFAPPPSQLAIESVESRERAIAKRSMAKQSASRDELEAAPRVAAEASQRAVAAPPPPPPAPASAPAARDAAEPGSGAGASESAEAWWARIVALRAAGRSDEADDEWEALEARYPDFEPPIPPQAAPDP